MKTKKNRKSIGKLQLAEALPIDKWFDVNDVNLDITSVSLRARLKDWPYIQTKLPNPQKILFKVSAVDIKHLLRWAATRNETVKSQLKQKTKPHHLNVADICHNLATGMHINKEQMSMICGN